MTPHPKLTIDPADPYTTAYDWQVIDPEVGDALTDPEDIERYRLVDCLVFKDKTLRVDDLLTLTLGDLRSAFQNREPRKRRRAAAIERTERAQRIPVRLADTGDMPTDFVLKDGTLHRVERWRGWVGNTPMDTQAVIPVMSAWVTWAGRRVRSEQIAHALANPEYLIPGGTVRRSPRAPRRR
jgi:hypothetical protein